MDSSPPVYLEPSNLPISSRTRSILPRSNAFLYLGDPWNNPSDRDVLNKLFQPSRPNRRNGAIYVPVHKRN